MEVDAMDRIAYIYGEVFIYWSSIVLTLAAVAAIFLFVGFYLYRYENALAAAVAIPLSIAF